MKQEMLDESAEVLTLYVEVRGFVFYSEREGSDGKELPGLVN
jgi:hypothetical protein